MWSTILSASSEHTTDIRITHKYRRQPRETMLTDQNYSDLEVKGYTVVPGVLTPEECDSAMTAYRRWTDQFTDGKWPESQDSLLQVYATGHLETSWEVKLKAKKVFEQLWKTEKLLSSFDAIAIGRPPEDGKEAFYSPKAEAWLHLDQKPSRDGLHCYQGGISLEESEEDDWSFTAMEGSHLKFKQFFENNPDAAKMAEMQEYYPLQEKELSKMKETCPVKRIPVPKGGIVLWDSRTVHANARPIIGRRNYGRWRFCVFVCMAPAIWATPKDIERKRKAYENAWMTTHWPSQGVRFFDPRIPKSTQEIQYPREVPDIARTEEAKLLAGVLEYDFDDGKPTGEELRPKWVENSFSHMFDNEFQ